LRVNSVTLAAVPLILVEKHPAVFFGSAFCLSDWARSFPPPWGSCLRRPAAPHYPLGHCAGCFRVKSVTCFGSQLSPLILVEKHPAVLFWKCVLPLKLSSIHPAPLGVMPASSCSVPRPVGPLHWFISSEKCDMFEVAPVPPDFGRKAPCGIFWKCVLPLKLS
jgi:hypothetical protein